MAIKTRQTTATGVTNVDAPLTNAEVDNNFVELQQNKVSTSGDTMTGDLNFGDSDKAIFGDGSDLEIYHDGSNSLISDTGTGNILISSSDLELQNGGGTTYLKIDSSGLGGLNLYYSGNEKLRTTSSGITVTGSIAVSGTVDGVDIAALNTSALTTSTTFGGDVSGTYDAIVVADDSHNHIISNVDGLQTALDAKAPTASPTFTGSITFPTGQTFDGRDVSADGTKLDGIEAGADVTDATNVQAAGALMDSELANESAVKGLNQSVATGSTPSFFNIGLSANTYTTIPYPYASGALYVADHIYHYGDTDTYIYMTSDDFRIVAGGRQMIRMDEGNNPDKLQFVDANNYVDSSGNWAMSGDVVWGGELRSGTFKFESDGTNHYIRNSAHTDGDIVIESESSTGVNQTLARFDSSGVYTYVALYYNNGLSMTTTTGGITVHEYVKHYGDTDTYMGFDAVASWVAYTDGSKRISANNNGFFVESAARENATALSGTTPTCNADSAGYFSLTMTGNTTFTFSAQTSGYSAGFVVELTGNGGTVTWPTSVDWAGGTAPDAPASGETDLLVFNTRDGGTTWYGMLAIDAAA
jgi:hypothetical protein